MPPVLEITLELFNEQYYTDMNTTSAAVVTEVLVYFARFDGAAVLRSRNGQEALFVLPSITQAIPGDLSQFVKDNF